MRVKLGVSLAFLWLMLYVGLFLWQPLPSCAHEFRSFAGRGNASKRLARLPFGVLSRASPLLRSFRRLSCLPPLRNLHLRQFSVCEHLGLRPEHWASDRLGPVFGP